MKLFLFVFSLSFLMVSNTINASDIQFTKNLIVQCIQDCAKGELSNLIGWSKHGKVAYLDIVSDVVPSGYADIYFVIEDLASNSFIFKEYCGRMESSPIIDSTQFNRIIKLLSINKIFYAPTNPAKFPIFYKNDSITIETHQEIIGTTMYNVNMGPCDTIYIDDFKITIIMQKINAGLVKKNQIRIKGAHFFGDWNQTIFFYQSPYNDWIAIPYYYSAPCSAAGIDISGIFKGENGMVGCHLGEGFSNN